MKKNYTLGVIGGGFMARAIVDGVIGKGFLSPSEIAVSDPSESSRKTFSEKGVNALNDNRAVADASEYLLFAIKPQAFSDVAKEISDCSAERVLTIMAGKKKETIAAVFKNPVRIARAMPNLPCSVGEGTVGIDTSEFNGEERAFAYALFGATGTVTEVSEELLNAVTGVSGSGPAYVYLFLKALVRAGVAQGLTESQAKALSLQTLKGGAKLVEEHPEKSLQELIDAVSSKGGTTVAALGSFANDDFEGSVARAVDAAVKRAEELSR